MRNRFNFIFFLTLLSTFFSSCLKDPGFSDVPKIEFKSIEKDIIVDSFSGGNIDSLTIGIYFEDGDGDLGYSEAEKTQAISNNDFNYLITSFRKVNGTFVKIETLEPISGYFTRLVPDGRKGPIKGNIFYSLNYQQAFTPKRDTMKFEVAIKDRSGNFSNTIETDQIIVNQF